MSTYEVTWRAAGPFVNGVRVEACVTIPVKAGSRKLALAEAEWDWRPLEDHLTLAAGSLALDVKAEVRKL